MPVHGRKDDGGKTRLELLPPRAIEAIGRVLTHGATKYGDENWRSVDNAHERYLGAAMRHINAWKLGHDNDADSGESHLAHAAAGLMFMIALAYDWRGVQCRECGLVHAAYEETCPECDGIDREVIR